MRTIMMMLGLIAMAACASAAEWTAPNLVKNSGFEEASSEGVAVGWSGDGAIYTRATGAKKSGEASLRHTNANPDRYVLCSQTIPLEPGKRYSFSMWVKTEGIDGSDTGATICIEYSDKDGKYCGGSYPAGVAGTSDWKQVTGVTRRIPSEAAAYRVNCYLRRGMTGTAWFDDVEVSAYREDPLDLILVAPNYRDEVTDAGPEKVRAHVELTLDDYGNSLDDVVLTWMVVGEAHQGTVAMGTMDDLDATEFDVEMPGKSLAPGPYKVQVLLRDKKSGDGLFSKSCSFRRIEGAPKRSSYIDKHNRLIVDGTPFFPLGMYWSGIRENELDVYANSAFNCLMPYGMPNQEQMDMAHERGLKVIYSVKDCYTFIKWHPREIQTEADELPYIRKKVEAFRDHPALLAWYLNDEAPVSEIKRLVAHKRLVEEVDPNHPTWTVLYQIDALRGYRPSFHILGTDPYPIPKSPASAAADWTRKTIDAVGGGRAVWMVPQVFNWAAYKKREEEKKSNRQPTYEEVRSMTWQCIVEGANGLVFYSWFNIYDSKKNAGLDFETYWPKVKAVAQEVKDLTPVILSVEETPAILAPEEAWLNWTTRQVGAKTYLLAVNNAPEAGKTRFTLPGTPERIVEVITNKEAPASGTGLDVEFEPFGLRVFEIAWLGK